MGCPQPPPYLRWQVLQQNGGRSSCGQGLGAKSGHSPLQVEGPFLHFLHGARHPVPHRPATAHSAALEQRFSRQAWYAGLWGTRFLSTSLDTVEGDTPSLLAISENESRSLILSSMKRRSDRSSCLFFPFGIPVTSGLPPGGR